ANRLETTEAKVPALSATEEEALPFSPPPASRRQKGNKAKAAKDGVQSPVGQPQPPPVVPDPGEFVLEDAGSEDDNLVNRQLRGTPAASPKVRGMQRHLSVKSTQALDQLSEIEGRLVRIEMRVAALHSRLEADRPSPLSLGELGSLKTELALLEAEAHKLETGGVDGVYTGGLCSGKADAKAAKRSQLERLEALFVQVDRVFQLVKQRQV
ncbi:unnamed protein product, partial [Polarella glacialis]